MGFIKWARINKGSATVEGECGGWGSYYPPEIIQVLWAVSKESEEIGISYKWCKCRNQSHPEKRGLSTEWNSSSGMAVGLELGSRDWLPVRRRRLIYLPFPSFDENSITNLNYFKTSRGRRGAGRWWWRSWSCRGLGRIDRKKKVPLARRRLLCHHWVKWHTAWHPRSEDTQSQPEKRQV